MGVEESAGDMIQKAKSGTCGKYVSIPTGGSAIQSTVYPSLSTWLAFSRTACMHATPSHNTGRRKSWRQSQHAPRLMRFMMLPGVSPNLGETYLPNSCIGRDSGLVFACLIRGAHNRHIRGVPGELLSWWTDIPGLMICNVLRRRPPLVAIVAGLPTLPAVSEVCCRGLWIEGQHIRMFCISG